MFLRLVKNQDGKWRADIQFYENLPQFYICYKPITAHPAQRLTENALLTSRDLLIFFLKFFSPLIVLLLGCGRTDNLAGGGGGGINMSIISC